MYLWCGNFLPINVRCFSPLVSHIVFIVGKHKYEIVFLHSITQRIYDGKISGHKCEMLFTPSVTNRIYGAKRFRPQIRDALHA